MRYKEFGQKHKPVLVLIHGFGVSWKMWEPIIPQFSEAYQIFVPLLPGHDLEQASVFQSIEDCAAEITGNLKEKGVNQVHAIIGCSLGGSITSAILALDKITIEHAIIDGGPLVPMNPILLKLATAYRYHFVIKACRKGRNPFTKTFFPPAMAEDAQKVCAQMSDVTYFNVHRSAFNYHLPESVATTKANVAYWYGSKEAFICKPYIRRLSQVLPTASINEFPGFNHGELVMVEPERFVQSALDFFHTPR